MINTGANIQELFADKIKNLRKGLKLSQGQLAEKLGVSRGSVSAYENCERVPDIAFLREAADYFAVSADWLLGLSDEPDAKKTAVDDLALSSEAIAAIRSFDPETKTLFSMMVPSEHFSAFLCIIKRLANTVNDTKKAHEKGLIGAVNDQEIMYLAEEELSQRLGYRVCVTQPRHTLSIDIENAKTAGENIAKLFSGYNDLTFAEVYDDAYDASEAELIEFKKMWGALYPEEKE